VQRASGHAAGDRDDAKLGRLIGATLRAALGAVAIAVALASASTPVGAQPAAVSIPVGAQPAATGEPAATCPPLPTPDTGRVIFGQLCQVIDGRAQFAKGVRITVSHDGTPIGSVRTDRQGKWQVDVPDATTYRVVLDVSTLPEPFGLTDKSKTVLPAVDTSFGSTRALFPLGQAASGPGTLSELLKLLGTGVKLGLVIGVAACGLSMVYGATGLINFAHGELVTLGALLTYLLSTTPGFGHLWLGLAALIAVLLVALFGTATDVVLWAPLRRRRAALLSMMVVSIGLSVLLRNVFQIFYGPTARLYGQYSVQREFGIGPFSLVPKDWTIIVVATGVLLAVTALIKYSRLGTAIRAVADNRDLAEASGIDVDVVIRWVWFIGSALAGLGGMLYGLTQDVKFDMGWLLLLALFAAVVLGGLGSAYGAILGGLFIGIVQEVATYWLDTSYQFAVPLAVLVVVLLFRPQGLLSQRERFG
jgi:branched-chain amino acid transport system permease protein